MSHGVPVEIKSTFVLRIWTKHFNERANRNTRFSGGVRVDDARSQRQDQQ